MKLLKQDLLIEADDSRQGVFFVRDPLASTRFKVDQREYFIAESIKIPYHETVLLAKYNARFDARLNVEKLQEILEKFDQWGLLVEEHEVPSAVQFSPTVESPAVVHESVRRQSSGNDEEIVKAERSKKSAAKKYKNFWFLFNPRPLLDLLISVFGFTRYFKKIVPVFFVLSLLAFILKFELFVTDLHAIDSSISFLGHLFFTLFTTNLVTQLFRGAVARNFNYDTPAFGMIFILGLLPRFNIRLEQPEGVTRKERLWVAGSPVYVRFFLFPLGIFLWLVTRSQGTVLPLVGAGLAMISMISFLFVANPLMGSAGYRFLSEYFNAPNLRRKAFIALRYKFRKPPAIVAHYIEDTPALRAYAVASIIFLGALIAFIGLTLAKWLESNYRGFGVSLFLLMVVYILLRLRQRRGSRGNQGRMKGGRVDSAQSIHPEKENETMHSTKKELRYRWPLARIVRYSITLIAIAGLFLPYQYETGGAAEVFPIATQEIYSEYPSIVEHVYYNGGEWLKEGTVIAEMINDKQKRDVENAYAEIEKQKQELQVLLTTPSKEEIALAEEELRKAKLKLRFSQENFGRIKELYEKKNISYAMHQDALEELQLDEQALKEKEANFKVIKSMINKHLIEATEINLEILHQDLHYYREVLDRTLLKMPFDGRIITMNLKDIENTFLDDGDVFAKAEDASSVRIEIQVPESDVGEVSAGDRVRVKLQVYPDKTIRGVVTKIYPTAIDDAYGRIVGVETVIDNSEGFFKTGMTGYGKVEGSEMFVIQAFTRAFVRFVQVEMWSWLP